MSKIKVLLPAIAAAVLVACGGGGGGSATSTLTGKVIDGYIKGTSRVRSSALMSIATVSVTAMSLAPRLAQVVRTR